MDIDVPTDYNANPNQMPRPYVRFEQRPVEIRNNDGSSTYKDVTWACITAQGGKDVAEKLAVDWIKSLQDHAKAGRIPQSWPREYQDALKAFEAGEAMEIRGTPIKSWSALTPGQRAAVLSANVLSVEDLAAANDEARFRIGMGAHSLVEMAKAWIAERNGPGALAARLDAALTENADLRTRLGDLEKTLADVMTRLPPEEKATAQPRLKVS